MAAPGNAGATARKHLRVLLPFTCGSLRIPDELAEDIGAAEARVVVPFEKGKVRRVEVGRDDDGAFLGRGWPEFAAECGVGAGWLLVLRHHGGGVLTVKAFDECGCLKELPTRMPAATASSRDTPCRPQFVSVLPSDSMQKMQIPSKFVQSCIPKEDLNSRMTVVVAPLAKIAHVEVEMNLSGLFFTGGWSEFLKLHSITDANCLLLRYEGKMVFTLKVFEPNGFQRYSKCDDIRFEQNKQTMALPSTEKRHKTPSASIQKCKRRNILLASDGQKKANISKIYLGKPSLPRKSVYSIEPPSWIMKQINNNSLKNKLALSTAFCNAIGLRESCMITLKTSMDSGACWQVSGWPCPKGSYLLMGGWKRFCKDNKLNEGDICTFNVVKTTLWIVDITRYNEEQGTPSASSMKSKTKNDRICCDKEEGSRTSLQQSGRKCVFDIGPPAWIKKEINASTIESLLSLPLTFCKAIGIRDEPFMITLKTSTSCTMTWQARVVPYETCSHLGGAGWRRFCLDNGLKEGDICTFNVIDTTLWHVNIVQR